MSIVLDRESFKALASETRILILKKLKLRQWTASELSRSLGVSVQAASVHLKKMRFAGLVKEEKRSKWVYYSLTGKGAALLNPRPQKSLWVLLGISLLAFAYASQLFLGGSANLRGAAPEKTLAMEDAFAAATPVPEPAMDYALIAALVVGSVFFGAFLYALLRNKKCVC